MSHPNGMVNQVYSQALAAVGGVLANSYAVTSGTLPTGLSLNTSSGAITGTPTSSAGSPFAFTIADTDAAGITVSQAYTVAISPLNPTTTTLTGNAPDPSLYGLGLVFTVSVTGGAGINGETVSIEDASANNTVVATQTLSNGMATFTLSSLSIGVHDLFAVYAGDSTHQNSQSSQITQTVQSNFGVGSVIATPSGVVLTFNAPIDPNTTVLYSSPGDTTLGGADVTVVGATTGLLRGSLVIDPTNPDVATFVQTSGLLATDIYTLTVTTAVKALGGATLSSNYTTTLNVTAPTTPVLSVPSFARGPGQSVNVPTSGNGIAISISNASNATQVSFTLTYDPTLLTIAGSNALSTTTSLTGITYTISSVDSP